MEFRIKGKVVSEGQVIESFRSEGWIYQGVAQAPEPGKVSVRRYSDGWQSVFYPGVFDGVIKSERCPDCGSPCSCGA